ncbi:hypothetical protein SDC9_105581 [bioreactor metagenome]|uniref:DUF1273 domain-containing protein n=1 Tax=bioreactor metagenome TaxID=1076179 RepID=A0A645B130_9ZZZZ
MNDKQKICCFSGHRPAKLSFGYDEEHPDCLRLKIRLLSLIDEMSKKGVTTFLTGMAQGVDIFAAEAVIDIRRTYPEDKIRLIAVIPYEGQADRWNEKYRERYFNILAKSDDVITLQHRYTDNCMLERDRYMVDSSAYLIAVYNGSKGGTKYTIDYAIKKGLDVTIINPNTLVRENIPPSILKDLTR